MSSVVYALDTQQWDVATAALSRAAYLPSYKIELRLQMFWPFD
jgi:hypothetical protein